MVVANKIGEKTGIPTWGVVGIFILIALIILGICGFCIRRCFRKRRSKDGKKGMKGVDLKSVQLLGSAYKEKVNIIMSMNVWLFRKKNLLNERWKNCLWKKNSIMKSLKCTYLNVVCVKNETIFFYFLFSLSSLCFLLPYTFLSFCLFTLYLSFFALSLRWIFLTYLLYSLYLFLIIDWTLIDCVHCVSEHINLFFIIATRQVYAKTEGTESSVIWKSKVTLPVYPSLSLLCFSVLIYDVCRWRAFP